MSARTPLVDNRTRRGAVAPEPLRSGHYEVRFADSDHDLELIQRLRFEVFNLELGEGFDSSFVSGLDIDPFDPFCDHLMVTDVRTDRVVGCYRMQTATAAAVHRGFYTSTIFDLSRVPADTIARSAEIGRACIARAHRSTTVLYLLWRGLAQYVEQHGLRYLFGCSSLTSQDPGEGSAVLRYLRDRGHVDPEWDVSAHPEHAFELADTPPAKRVPTLFRTYLRFGAKVCGTPGIDREFRTIDFFVVLDVESLNARSRRMFFG